MSKNEKDGELAKCVKEEVQFESTPLKFVREDEKIALKRDENKNVKFQEIVGVKDVELGTDIFVKGLYAFESEDMRNPAASNILLQSLNDQSPKDSIEARLIAQGTALYSQGMVYLGKADRAESFHHMQWYGNMATKILRLHNETIEALNRYRRGGEQKVLVQHVNVSEGGQAIVGNIEGRGGM